MPRSLVEAADAAMYESKRAGRNCVVLSPAPQFAVATTSEVAATSELPTTANAKAE